MINIGHKGVADCMMDYQKAYEILFNGITNALAELEKEENQSREIIKAAMILQGVQRQTEELYMEAN